VFLGKLVAFILNIKRFLRLEGQGVVPRVSTQRLS